MRVSRRVIRRAVRRALPFRIKAILQVALPLIAFAVALFALHREVSVVSYDELLRDIRKIGSTTTLAALALSFLNYGVLGLYDLAAVRWLGLSINPFRAVLAGVASFAVSQTVGMPLLSSAAVRMRIYGRWGISTPQVAKLVTFNALHFWIGMVTLGSICLLFEPSLTRKILGFDIGYPIVVAAPILLCVVLYIVVPRTVFPDRLASILPSRACALAATSVGSLDWLLASSIFYLLLAPSLGIPYIHVLATFLFAQLLGLVSQVPGGVGVFEAIVTMSLAPQGSPGLILGSLILFRCTYYLVPFSCALIGLAMLEVASSSGLGKVGFRIPRPQILTALPSLIAVAVFLIGLSLLLSGASPTAAGREWWLTEIVPLPIAEGSHFVNSIVGTLLLVLASSVRARVRTAWLVTVILLVLGSVTSIVKGFDYEVAFLALFGAGLVFQARSAFTRPGVLFNKLTSREFIACGVSFLSVLWLGLFCYREVEYSHDMWWEFSELSDASRFLRMSVASAIVLLVCSHWRLLRPRLPAPVLPSIANLDAIAPLVHACADTEANLSLLGDKFLFRMPDSEGFIMYRISGRSWVALGDPVAPTPELREALAWSFRETCDRHGGWPVFYGCKASALPLYLDLGLDVQKLGEEALVDLADFTLEGSERKSFRQIIRKLEKEGFSFSIIPPSEVEKLLPELEVISQAWLGGKTTNEKRCSLGFFDPEYLRRFSCAIVRRDGVPVAFANIFASTGKEQLSVDLMRFFPDVANGIMDYLFLNLMLWGRTEGYLEFTFGMAPLSRLSIPPLAPLWNKAGSYVYKHGEHFYNFRGVRSYKEKFNPRWEPRYLASPGGFVAPLVLANVATLISGGLRGLVIRS